MLGGMMQSIGVGGTVESSELNLDISGTGAIIPMTRSDIAIDGYSFRLLDGGLTMYNDTDSRKEMTFSGDGSIGIGTSAPNSTALLDITSTDKGFLPPRMTTAQRDAISSPATGLVIYNTTTDVLNFYNGSAWGAV